MQNYQHGSVVLLALPFSDTTTFKLRPALVLLEGEGGKGKGERGKG